MNVCYSVLLLSEILCTTCITAQDDQLQNGLSSSPGSSKFLTKVSNQPSQLNEKLDKKTTKALRQWQRQEEKLKTNITKRDFDKAIAIFGNSRRQFDQLERKKHFDFRMGSYPNSFGKKTAQLSFLSSQLLKGRSGKLSLSIFWVNFIDPPINRFMKTKLLSVPLVNLLSTAGRKQGLD
jgi:hypothetical protein